jgi:hypothetical protein
MSDIIESLRRGELCFVNDDSRIQKVPHCHEDDEDEAVPLTHSPHPIWDTANIQCSCQERERKLTLPDL